MYNVENDSRRLGLNAPRAPQAILHSPRRNHAPHPPSPSAEERPLLFLPAEDEGDKKVLRLMELKKMDAGAWLTEVISPPALNRTQFSALCYILYRSMMLENFTTGYPFNINHVLKNSSDYALLARIARRALCYYVGGGCKKDVLGADYFQAFLSELSRNTLTISSYTRNELSQGARDDDFQVVLEEMFNPGATDLEKMVDNTTVFFARQTITNYDMIRTSCLINRTVLENFSLISWNNQLPRSFDLVFKPAGASDCFVESGLCIPLNDFLCDQLAEPDLYGIPASYYSNVFPEGHGGEKASQGLIDCMTGVLHVRNIENMNEFTWSMLLAYLSKNRRFYEPGCVANITNKVVHKEIDLIAELISKHLDQHYFTDLWMRFAMTCNGCLTLQPFLEDQALQTLWQTLLPKDFFPKNDFSVFSLIAQGITDCNLLFKQVIHIHQLFALISLSVKKPEFEFPRSVFLTKHDGEPAIKIQEGTTILLPFETVESFTTLMELVGSKKTFKIITYLTKVFEAYLPTNSFEAKQGSQLSPYKDQLSSRLAPLCNLAKEGVKHKDPLMRQVSYYLLLGCQTSNPSSLECTLEALPFIMGLILPKEQRERLLKSVENLLIHSKATPWSQYGKAIFTLFKQRLEVKNCPPEVEKTPLVAWMETLAACRNETVFRIAVKLWRETREISSEYDDHFSTNLILMIARHDLSIAIAMFKEAEPMMGVPFKKRYEMFLDFASKLQFESCVNWEAVGELLSIASLFLLDSALPVFLRDSALQAYIETPQAASRRVFLWVTNAYIQRKELANARKLLVDLINLGIFSSDDREVVGAWVVCFQNILNDPQQAKERVSMWKQGKKFKIWSSEHFPGPQFTSVLFLLESLYASGEKSEDLRKRMLVDLCQLPHQKEELPRVRSLILQHLATQSTKAERDELPESFISYLPAQDLRLIHLNALKYEITHENLAECLTLLKQLLDGQSETYSAEIQEATHKVFGILILKDESILAPLLPQINDIYKNIHFYVLFPIERSLASYWLCECIKKMKGDKQLQLCSSAVQDSLGILVQRVFASEEIKGKLNEARCCLDFLLTSAKLPSAFEGDFATYRGAMFQASFLLSDLERLKNFICYLRANEGFENLDQSVMTKYVQVSTEILTQARIDPTVLLALHQMWKDIQTDIQSKKKENSLVQQDYQALVESLLAKLLQSQQIPFALFWSNQCTAPSAEMIRNFMHASLEIAQDQAHHALAILEMLYTKKWLLEDSSKAWVDLVEQLLKHQFQSIVYLFMERKEEAVLPDLKEYTAELFQPLMDTACQNVEDLAFYARLLEHGKIKPPACWIDLLEKTLGFGQANLSTRILDAFDAHVVRGNALTSDSLAKAKCLVLAARLLERVKSPLLKKWLESSQFKFLADPALQSQRQYFHAHLIDAAFKYISKKELLESMTTHYAKNVPSDAFLELWVALSLMKDADQPKNSLAILEMFYKKRWLRGDGSKAWIYLVEQLVQHQFHAVVYGFTLRKEKAVLPDLKAHAKKLMQPLVDSTCQSTEELSLYLRLVAHFGLSKSFHWLDLLEKTLGFGNAGISKQVLEAFNAHVVKGEDVANDPQGKAEGLVLCARILREMRGPLLYEWLQNPPLQCFTDLSTINPKKNFCAHFLDTILKMDIDDVKLLLASKPQLCLLSEFVSEELSSLLAMKVIRGMILSVNAQFITDGCEIFIRHLKSNDTQFVDGAENLLLQLLSNLEKLKKLMKPDLVEKVGDLLEAAWMSRREIPFKLVEACAAHSQETFVYKAFALLLDLFSGENEKTQPGSYFYKLIMKGLRSKSSKVREIVFDIARHPQAPHFLEETYAVMQVKMLEAFLRTSNDIIAISGFIDKFDALKSFPKEKRTCLELVIGIIVTNYAKVEKTENFILYTNKIFGIWITDSIIEPLTWSIEHCGSYLLPSLLFFSSKDVASSQLKKVIPTGSIPDLSDEVLGERACFFLETMLRAFFKAAPHQLYPETINVLLLLLIQTFAAQKNKSAGSRETISSLMREFVFYRLALDWSGHLERCEYLYECIIEHEIASKDSRFAAEIYFFLKGMWLPESRAIPLEEKAVMIIAAIEHHASFHDNLAVERAIESFKQHRSVLLRHSVKDYHNCFKKILSGVKSLGLFPLLKSVIISEGKLYKLNGEEVQKDPPTLWMIGADDTPQGLEFACQIGCEFFDAFQEYYLKRNKYDFCHHGANFLLAMLHAKGFELHFEEYYKRLRIVGEELINWIKEPSNTIGATCSFFPAILLAGLNKKINEQQRVARIKELDYWMQRLQKLNPSLLFMPKAVKGINEVQLSKKIADFEKLKKGRSPGRCKENLNLLEQKALVNLIHLMTSCLGLQIPKMHAFYLLKIVQKIILDQGEDALNAHGYNVILICYQHIQTDFSSNAMESFGDGQLWQYLQEILIKRRGNDRVFHVAASGSRRGLEVASELCKLTFESFFRHRNFLRDVSQVQDLLKNVNNLQDIFEKINNEKEKELMVEKTKLFGMSCEDAHAHYRAMLSFLEKCVMAGGFHAKPHYYYNALQKILEAMKPQLHSEKDQQLMFELLTCIYQDLHKTCYEKMQELINEWISAYASQKQLEVGLKMLETVYQKDNGALVKMAQLFRPIPFNQGKK